MKINSELSEMMFEKYNHFENDKVDIILKNGQKFTGFLMGCYHDIFENVLAWDFLEDKYVEEGKEINIFASDENFRIEQKDIQHVYFYEDQSTIIFLNL